MSSLAGFLCVGGTEVVNEARTRAYLRNCLGDSSWQFFDDCDCPPLAAHVIFGDCAMVLDGTAGTFVSTPDVPHIPGDITLIGFAALDTYGGTGAVQVLVGRGLTRTSDSAFRLVINNTGFVLFGLYENGTTPVSINRDPGALVPGQPVGFMADWRQSDKRARVFMADDPEDRLGTTWTQLGTDGTINIASIFDSSQPVTVGNLAGSQTLNWAPGKHFYSEARDGVDPGTLVASPDFTAQAPGTTSFTDAQGNVWTLNGNAEIACTLDAYGSPASDPAPWYSAAHPASEKFFGFIPERVESSVPTARRVTDRLSEGATLGPEQLLSRSYSFRGWLVAADEEGMRWGMRWMREVLRGRICAPGCEGDDGELLISCADPSYFRSLVGVGLIDGPRYDVAVPDNHESVAVPTQFQIASQSSYLFSDGASVVSGVVADEADACAFFTTDEWFAGASLDIELTTALNAEDITITMAISLDGTCDNLAAACAVIEIPFLPAESRLKIDGRRRTVTFFDPTGRVTRTGFNVTRWQGAFPWFDVEACAQMCICFDNAGPSPVTWRVTKFEKEL